MDIKTGLMGEASLSDLIINTYNKTFVFQAVAIFIILDFLLENFKPRREKFTTAFRLGVSFNI